MSQNKSNDEGLLIIFLLLALWFFSAGVETVVQKFGYPLPDWTSFSIFVVVLNLAAAIALFRAVFRSRG